MNESEAGVPSFLLRLVYYYYLLLPLRYLISLRAVLHLLLACLQFFLSSYLLFAVLSYSLHAIPFLREGTSGQSSCDVLA